jgi:peptidyl-prolyl cis-trans isomerase B (cyclophilin B)
MAESIIIYRTVNFKKTLKYAALVLAAAVITALVLAGCAKNGADSPRVEIVMESGGTILLELDAKTAPITVENFLALAKDGFYDGLTFHRIIPGFMIQGGDPEGTGGGGSSETIKGEFEVNGVKNSISHKRGVISMARVDDMNPTTTEDYNSASSQFFITNTDSTFLDGSYAAFGRVIEGMDVVDEISAVPTDASDKPLEPVVIKTVKVP